MTIAEQQLNDSMEILVGELLTNEELLDSFLQDPEWTLRLADDWALPLSASEIHSLRTSAYRLWDKVAVKLEERLSSTC